MMNVFSLERIQKAFNEVFANKQELLNSGEIENHVNKSDAKLLQKFADGDENVKRRFTELSSDDVYIMKALGIK